MEEELQESATVTPTGSIYEKTDYETRTPSPVPSIASGKKESSTDLDQEAAVPSESEVALEYPTGFRLAAIVIALILSVFLVSLDQTIVATAIPAITDQFKSLSDIGWYGSAFFLTLASFQSTWGKGYKYFDIKTTFLVSIFIFEVGSLICGVSQNSTTLIVGRAIAGAGGAGIASGAYTIIAFAVPPKQRPAYTGILGAIYGVSSVLGPLLGGVFTDKVTWRWSFLINLPIGGVAAAIILLIFTLPNHAKPVEATWTEKLIQMDPVGTFTIMAAVICYLLALQWGGSIKPWNDPSVIGILVGFVLLLIVFGINEYFMGERALLQGRLLKSRTIIVMVFYVSLVAGGFFAILYYLPIYFQAVDGVSPAQSGVRNIPLVLATSIFTILSGTLISQYGVYVPLMVLGSIFATVGAGLIFTLDINSSSGKWIGFQILAGIGAGLGIQIPIIVGQASVELSDIASISSIILFFQTIGGSFFVSAGQAAFANQLLSNVARTNPGLNPAVVLGTGATQLRSAFDASELPGILASYLVGLHAVFALTIAMGGISLIAAFFAPWKRINASAATGAA